MPGRDEKTRGVVLVSGAGSGIGDALARRFALERYVVVGCGRHAGRLNILARSIGRAGGIFIPVACDIRDEKGIRKIKRAVGSVGSVDILVNNAGVTYFKDFISTTAEEFDNIIETNVRGMFLLTKATLPAMLKRRQGLIINIFSFAAKTVYTGSSVYSASKSAGASLMTVLREEVRQQSIKILNVYPGATSTPMWSPRNRSRFEHRMMRPSEIAELVVRMVHLPASMMVEEIAFRPQRGDLRV